MKRPIRTLISGVSRSPGSWLTPLLLFVVVVPSAGLLWFVNRAAENEQLAVQQTLVAVYRAHLEGVQARVAQWWSDTGARLDREVGELPAAELFEREVRAERADAIVALDGEGQAVYPKSLLPIAALERPGTPWTEARELEGRDPAAAAAAYARIAVETSDAALGARAVQARVRCLILARDREAVLDALGGALGEERYREATDAQGRLLVPDAVLLALEFLARENDPRVDAARGRLVDRLNRYQGEAMPSAQRRRLMRALAASYPESAVFPTLAGEELAAQWLEDGRVATPRAELAAAEGREGLWRFATPGGRVVTLHRTDGLAGRLRREAAQAGLPEDARIEFFPPGREVEGVLVSMAAGAAMPGWRLGLVLGDQRLSDRLAAQRVAAYFWSSILVVTTVVLVGALVWSLLRRQVALTRLRNDLVANVSHELKTPLASIRLFVDTLLESPALDPATMREYLGLIARENLRLSRLIDNFLTFSRIERNKFVFAFHPVEPAALVEAAVAAVRDRFREPGCDLEVRVVPGLPRVRADADAWVTALVNLLDNAYKYSGDTKRVELAALGCGGAVEFSVRDNGVGMTAGETKRVFQRFYRVDRGDPGGTSGCGLGLSIVKFVVDAHGAAVRVASEPGAGSTFTLSLPAHGRTEEERA